MQKAQAKHFSSRRTRRENDNMFCLCFVLFDPSNGSIPAELLEVLFPFHGQQLLFGVVAFLAAGHYVAFGALAAAGYGHNVIHGQVFGRNRPAAIMAGAFCQAALPPLGLSQSPGAVALPFLVVQAKVVGVGLKFIFLFHFGLCVSICGVNLGVRYQVSDNR